MSVLNTIASLYYRGRLNQIHRMSVDPVGMQRQQLRSLIDAANDTGFGRDFSFRKIQSYADFAEAVPVTDYEHFASWVDRMVRGEANVSWPGVIRWFAKSSGTTDAKSKFIPVSDQGLQSCHYRGVQDVLAFYLSRHPDSNILSGKCLTLGGSKKISSINANCQTGDLSAIMLGNAPGWSNFLKTPSPNVALMDKWEEKLVAITNETIHQNVTYLAGVPSWFMVLLKHIMAHQGVDNIHDVWPNLQLFMHGGINFEPYRKQYQAIAPKCINFMETYNASEGFFAFQTDDNDHGLQLMLDYGVFFEFVPLDEVGLPHPQHACMIADVVTGVDYAIVISTNCGLWRYMIGDTVRFTSTNPFKIVISGRTKLYINAFGEELMIGNAEAAMLKACSETGAVVREYTAAPVFMDGNTRGRHQWLVEFEKEPADPDLFARSLDAALQSVNSDYEAKRYKDITLDPLSLTVARQGLFFDWMNAQGKLGGQNKVPRLKNDRSIIDPLLAMNV